MALTSNQIRVEAALRVFLASGVLSKGDRLPTFPDLAKRLGTSVSVLQVVVPRLAAQGIIEVMPRVGVFLRRKPGVPAGGQMAGTALRFSVTESVDGASPGWRRVAERFERMHPGVQVQLTLGSSTDPLLRQPDLVLLVHVEALRRIAKGGCLEWAVEGVWAPDQRVGPARELWQRERPTAALPVLLGMQALFLARSDAQLPMPANLPDLVGSRCRGAEGFGLVISAIMESFWSMGLGSCGIDPADPVLREWLRQLATLPPPALVTAGDFADEAISTRMAPLVGRRCRAYLGSLWMARLAERGVWDIGLPPGTGPVSGSTMDLVVPDGPHAEAAIALARFIAGPEGQRILAEEDALLPTWKSVAVQHRHAALLSELERRGVPPCSMSVEASWDDRFTRAKQVVDALRAGRATVDEAAEALAAVDRLPR